MRILLFIFLLALGVSAQVPVEPGVSHDLAKWRAAHYSDVRYKLNLTLEKMSPVLKGTIEIRVRVDEETGRKGEGETKAETRPVGSVPPIILDWRKIAGHDKDSTISNVTINGTYAVPNGVIFDEEKQGGEIFGPRYKEINEHLIFDDHIIAGENVIKLDFTSAILTSGSAITRYVDKEDGAEYIYSLFVPSDASTAFPVFDQPDLKAKFSLIVDAPKDWKVISNQVREENVYPSSRDESARLKDKIERTFAFPDTKPISTYIFAFAAGNFTSFQANSFTQSPTAIISTSNDVGFTKALAGNEIYVRKSQAGKFKPHAAEIFRLTRKGIKYLETYFDYKFPFPKYDIVLIPEFPFGGMEHAGATFLRESSVIFPTEPTKGDYISRANLIFHETAHQWFGDCVTMKWFDDLWLKEGFAEFMAYKTLEKVMPDANAWKVFYERNKQAAYQTDSTRGTTPIYQEIKNLSAAKSAYGNIVYRKAPSFLRQAEFYLGEDKFQTAVRAFLKKHEFANAGWEDLVKEFETASGMDLKNWANAWVKQRGMPIITGKRFNQILTYTDEKGIRDDHSKGVTFSQKDILGADSYWLMKSNTLLIHNDGKREIKTLKFDDSNKLGGGFNTDLKNLEFAFPNYQDYGYGIFLLDDKSRDYVLKNIQNEKDTFLRSMMWGSLWDSVREAELAPRDYVELVVKNLDAEQDESTIQTLLGRVGTALNYYIDEQAGNPSSSDGVHDVSGAQTKNTLPTRRVSASGTTLLTRLETLLIERMQNAPTLGQRITFYRAFLNIASTENARVVLKRMLAVKGGNLSSSEGVPNVVNAQAKNTLTTGRVSASVAATGIPLRTKDRFDIVTKLLILKDPEAPKLLIELEKTETSDEAKRYAYAARAGIANAENKAKFWNDFVNNKEVAESWIESALAPFNSSKHAELSLPYLEKALAELPDLKRNRKIFFVNGWLAAFIGGQKSEEALAIVNKFLADNPNLDKDLRLKILENVDLIERAVKIRTKYAKN